MKTITALVLTLCAAPLPAALITARFDATAPSSTVQRQITDSPTNANWTTLTVGLFLMTRTGGDYVGDFTGGTDSSFNAFCIEPQEGVTQGQTYTWTFQPLENAATNINGIGVTRANQVRELLGRHYPLIGASLTTVQAAALQVALWEIVRENSGTLDVYNGTTRFRNEGTPGVLAQAQAYVTSLNGTGPMVLDIFALTVIGNQDLVVQLTSTPEPTTLSLMLLAAVPMAIRLRRRQR